MGHGKGSEWWGRGGGGDKKGKIILWFVGLHNPGFAKF